jgi:hypothetical protein
MTIGVLLECINGNEDITIKHWTNGHTIYTGKKFDIAIPDYSLDVITIYTYKGKMIIECMN